MVQNNCIRCHQKLLEDPKLVGNVKAHKAHREDRPCVECHREDPDRRHAELGAPEADRDHCNDVVQAGNRVRHSTQEAAGLARMVS